MRFSTCTSDRRGGRRIPDPIELVSRLTSIVVARLQGIGPPPEGILWLELGTMALFVALAVALVAARKWAGALLVGSNLLLFLSLGTLSGTPRFVLHLFPALLLVARSTEKRPALRFAWMALGLGVGTILVARFVHWLWVA